MTVMRRSQNAAICGSCVEIKTADSSPAKVRQARTKRIIWPWGAARAIDSLFVINDLAHCPLAVHSKL